MWSRSSPSRLRWLSGCAVRATGCRPNADRFRPRTRSLIGVLSACGFDRIETTSFVDAKRVPQFADAAAAMAGLLRRPELRHAIGCEDVGTDGRRNAAGQLGGELIYPRRRRSRGAGLGKGDGGGPADAARGTGDEDDLAFRPARQCRLRVDCLIDVVAPSGRGTGSGIEDTGHYLVES